MSDTYGEQEIGQPDERDQPADTSVPSSATEWVLGRTEPSSPERQDTRDMLEQQEEGKSEGSGRPEDVAEEGMPDQETLQEETPGVPIPHQPGQESEPGTREQT